MNYFRKIVDRMFQKKKVAQPLRPVSRAAEDQVLYSLATYPDDDSIVYTPVAEPVNYHVPVHDAGTTYHDSSHSHCDSGSSYDSGSSDCGGSDGGSGGGD